jgi:hypothetical protein
LFGGGGEFGGGDGKEGGGDGGDIGQDLQSVCTYFCSPTYGRTASTTCCSNAGVKPSG